MSPGQTGHITGQMGRVPGTDGTHTSGGTAKILYVYWFSHLFSRARKKGFSFFARGATPSRTVPETQPLQVAFSLLELGVHKLTRSGLNGVTETDV